MTLQIGKTYSAEDAVKELRAMTKRAKAAGDTRAAMVLRYAADRINKQIKEVPPEIEPEIAGIHTTWRHTKPTQYGLKPLLTKEMT